MYDMTGWNPNVSQWTIAVTGFIQGAGLGFLFVPLNTVTFATLAPEQRADGTGLFNLSRNVGSSVGISIVSYLLIRNNQINHATIASHVTAVNHAFDNGIVRQAWSPWTAGGRAALDQVIQTQASIISYIDDFKLMMILSLAAIPLVLLLRERPGVRRKRPCDGDGMNGVLPLRWSRSCLKSEGANTMHKFFVALFLLSVSVSASALAHSGTDQDEKACTRDVQRFCRKLMDQGDFTILACLKENRPKLSPACRYVLVSHGQ